MDGPGALLWIRARALVQRTGRSGEASVRFEKTSVLRAIREFIPAVTEGAVRSLTASTKQSLTERTPDSARKRAHRSPRARRAATSAERRTLLPVEKAPRVNEAKKPALLRLHGAHVHGKRRRRDLDQRRFRAGASAGAASTVETHPEIAGRIPTRDRGRSVPPRLHPRVERSRRRLRRRIVRACRANRGRRRWRRVPAQRGLLSARLRAWRRPRRDRCPTP